MATNTLFVFEIVIFNGAALGWAGWELWSLRRDKRKSDDVLPPSPEPPRHPEG